jgi:hypothetical protein
MRPLIKMDGRGHLLSSRVYKQGYLKRKGKDDSPVESRTAESGVESPCERANSEFQTERSFRTDSSSSKG